MTPNKKSKTTYAIPLMILVLLIPMGSVGAQTAPGDDEPIDNIGPVGIVDDLTPYEQFVLDNMPDLEKATKQDKKKYITDFRDYIDKFTGYESTFMNKLGELALADKNLDDAKASNETPKKIAEYESQKAMRVFELEDLGITTKDRFNANPEYWIQKAINAKKAIESFNTSSVSDENDSSNIHYVHQSNDLALKRTSVLTFPCWNGLNCPIISSGWNTGSSTSEIWFIPTDGQVSFRSGVCLDGATHHDEVHFNMRIQRDIHSILQTELYSFDRNWNKTIDDVEDCHTSIKNKDVNAGSRAGMTTSIRNISFD